MAKIKFACNVIKWFDKINGNTYHSCRITRTSDGKEIAAPFQYGYDSAYKTTALLLMQKEGWINKKEDLWVFERENHYPILWNVSDGLKRECVTNGYL